MTKHDPRIEAAPLLTSAEIKAECERIWNRPGVAHPFHKNLATFGYKSLLGVVSGEPCIVLSRGATAPAFRMIETNRHARLMRLVEKNQRKPWEQRLRPSERLI